MRRISFLLLAALSLVAGSSAWSQDVEKNETDVETIAFELEVLREEVYKPFREFQNQYEGALTNLAEEQKAKGNLDTVLEIQQEKNSFRENTTPGDPYRLDRLNELRKIYLQESTNRMAEVQKAESKLLSNYLSKLDNLTTLLTREAKVDEAVALRDYADTLRGELEELNDSLQKPSSTSQDSEYVILGEGTMKNQEAGEIEIRSEDGLFILKSLQNKSRIESRKEFRPPYQILCRAMTDSTNIRFYFGQNGIAVFNWEVIPTQMRFNEPVDGRKHGIQDQGAVSVNEMHDFLFTITKDEINILVDSEQRLSFKGDYSDTSGTVGVGPAHQSTVTVEYLKVIEGQAK